MRRVIRTTLCTAGLAAFCVAPFAGASTEPCDKKTTSCETQATTCKIDKDAIASIQCQAQELARIGELAAREGQVAAQQAVLEMIESGELQRITDSALREARHAMVAFAEQQDYVEGEEPPLGALVGQFARGLAQEVLASMNHEQQVAGEHRLDEFAQLRRVVEERAHEHEGHGAHERALEELHRAHELELRHADHAVDRLHREHPEEAHERAAAHYVKLADARQELKREIHGERRELEQARRELERERKKLEQRIKQLERELERTREDAPAPRSRSVKKKVRVPAPRALRISTPDCDTRSGFVCDDDKNVFFHGGDGDAQFFSVGSGSGDAVIRIEKKGGTFLVKKDGLVIGEPCDIDAACDGGAVIRVDKKDGNVRIHRNVISVGKNHGRLIEIDGPAVRFFGDTNAEVLTIDASDGVVKLVDSEGNTQILSGDALTGSVLNCVTGSGVTGKACAPAPTDADVSFITAPRSSVLHEDIAAEVHELMREVHSQVENLRADMKELRHEMQGMKRDTN